MKNVGYLCILIALLCIIEQVIATNVQTARANRAKVLDNNGVQVDFLMCEDQICRIIDKKYNREFLLINGKGLAETGPIYSTKSYQ